MMVRYYVTQAQWDELQELIRQALARAEDEAISEVE